MMSAAEAFAPLRAALGQAGVLYAVGGSCFRRAPVTNDIDILADFTEENVQSFLSSLPNTFFADLPLLGKARNEN